MEHDRVAEIPVYHRRVNYICTIGYSKYNDSFDLIHARYADPHRTDAPQNDFIIFKHILIEPALRATLLEVLVPEAKQQISDLREKIILKKATNFGFWIGFSVFILTGLFIYVFSILLNKYIGYEWSQLIITIPAFFAVLIIAPVSSRVESQYLRRYCNVHGHRFRAFKKIMICDRCGFSFNSSTQS